MKIDSDPNEMIATHPEMKAEEVCEKTIKALQNGEFKFLRVNFATVTLLEWISMMVPVRLASNIVPYWDSPMREMDLLIDNFS